MTNQKSGRIAVGGMPEAGDRPLGKLKKKTAHILMVFLVFSWGLEYPLAKNAIGAMDVLTLIFLKYTIAWFVIIGIKFRMEGKGFMQRKDIVLFMLCAASGEILYFMMEYHAMNYLPVSLITILLTFVPVVSIFIEWIAYKRSPSVALLIGIGVSILGLVMIVGVDLDAIRQGRLVGYLLSLGAIFSWNLYNFITAHLGGNYKPLTLTFNQLTCTVLIAMPYALGHLPDFGGMDRGALVGVLYLGFVSASVGFVIYVAALGALGPTTVAIYANFMPITATLFGWMLLGEMVTGWQIVGGLVVIASGYFVIREKGRLEGLSDV